MARVGLFFRNGKNLGGAISENRKIRRTVSPGLSSGGCDSADYLQSGSHAVFPFLITQFFL